MRAWSGERREGEREDYPRTFQRYPVSRVIFQQRVPHRTWVTDPLFISSGSPRVSLSLSHHPVSSSHPSDLPRAPPASPIHPSCLLSHSLSLFLLLFYFYLSLLALTALLQLSSSHRIIPPSHTPVLIPSYHPRRETQACSLADGCVRALVRVCRRRPSRYPVYVCVLATEHTPASLDVGGVIRSKRPKRKGDEEEKSGERVRQEGCGNTGK